MAEDRTARGQRQQRQREEEERKPTKRKILKRERVIVIPAEADDDAVKTALKEAKLPSWLKPTIGEAWIVVAENEALSEAAAIEAHAGKRNTPDAKPGIWKAVSERSWKGGLVYERPPEPKVEASLFED